ncbi:unnamed protein product [Blepharisma stoltei]|uniref:Uncharacterized protein n=1 Tax=Blepharisma stoltei TaxID=1481888 RepID=A0AAU9IUJ5_9CILI|nr:unnamed protein product [Blepharisma stoltei]CAG9315417.1 unnamed protein product [Blepharisma stoltei]
MIKCLKVCTECIATVYFKKLKNLRKKVQKFFCTKNSSKKVHVLCFVLKISVKSTCIFFYTEKSICLKKSIKKKVLLKINKLWKNNLNNI